MATVAKKSTEINTATVFNLRLSMKIFTLPYFGDNISDVIRSTTAITASKRLISQKFIGKTIRFFSPRSGNLL